jgi:hypothetical protein
VTLPDDIELARAGDRTALRRVVGAMAELVYPLAAWALGCPREAGLATQQILIRLVTALGSFHGDRLWVYRVAADHLRTSTRDAHGLYREDRLALLGELLALDDDNAASVRLEALVRDPLAELPALEAPDALADDLHALITGKCAGESEQRRRS